MVKSKQPPQLNEAEIRAVYREGEDAVVSLVSELLTRLNKLEEEVNTLRGQLRKNSRNSSKPPSGDGFGKRTRSLRRKSERPSGGQVGHRGQTLEWRSQPDFVEPHDVSHCGGCGASLSGQPVEEVISRQVFDLPPLELMVSEHQALVKRCPVCGQSSQGSFPAEAKTMVQYGPRLKGLMVYLMEGQLLPSARSCEVLSDVLGVDVSEGTLYTAREQCFTALAPIEAAIGDAIKAAPVVHFDETGMRVNQRLWWLHVACTDGLTYYFAHPRRGQVAINEMDILPKFEGKAVHDGWKSYQGYDCEHVLCNAHHLRELQYVIEHYGQPWAFQLSLLLVSIHSWVKALKVEGKTALASEDLAVLEARYDAILKQGFDLNPMPETDPTVPKKRGRPKRPPPLNLLERLRTHKAAVLGFMYDFNVPFDNNQAERDLRMMKLKQKISGCFRSEDGAKRFCRIRGYLSTLRKQEHNLLEALMRLFVGDPLSPLTQPE